MSSVTAQGYVLHTRQYRESSLILHLFSDQAGVVSAVAKGARGKKGHGLLPFRRLRLRWIGRAAMVTLVDYEPVQIHAVAGAALGAGLYLNELLVRLIREREPVPNLYAAYGTALTTLTELTGSLEIPLRRFEKVLLNELGYQVDFTTDALSGQPIEPDHQYAFDPDAGFHQAASGFSGRHILAIGTDQLDAAAVRRTAKVVFRDALRPHLGQRPLASRAFFEAGHRSATSRSQS